MDLRLPVPTHRRCSRFFLHSGKPYHFTFPPNYVLNLFQLRITCYIYLQSQVLLSTNQLPNLFRITCGIYVLGYVLVVLNYLRNLFRITCDVQEQSYVSVAPSYLCNLFRITCNVYVRSYVLLRTILASKLYKPLEFTRYINKIHNFIRL